VQRKRRPTSNVDLDDGVAREDQLQQFRIDAFEGHLVPAAVIALPGAWHVLRARRREEPGEDGSLGVKAHDLLDEALQPNLGVFIRSCHRPSPTRDTQKAPASEAGDLLMRSTELDPNASR
jgi:hypothetical protein